MKSTDRGASRPDLPVLDHGVPHERADAARNRLKVLAAAEKLFGERGVDAVSMDEVAAEAKVGKGTLYRRFGDKSGLAAALLDERGRALQQRMLSGPPPLGPGAPAEDRLVAFVQEYLAYLDSQLDLVLMSQTAAPGARFRNGAHAFFVQHVHVLLQEAGADDARARAEFLMAGLAAEQVRHWRRVSGISLAALQGQMAAAARQLAKA
ncbi:TetR/AcrR family transcriptional regulator [Streptomyces heilongjiangensis]|uniref:TetR/AcrR family transcriptional regulator n=1 Tax=Streptomyces heilongjiangensis TaxID=945052 RepID=A0ABW1AYV5_9ACTN|nr:TetR/AcrR family transcriptional regulator [Streptomyces heilongjiangensis]MDC2947927.1 helix-turn-helix domain containing protein [Streptomyces heilongjiangensis]